MLRKSALLQERSKPGGGSAGPGGGGRRAGTQAEQGRIGELHATLKRANELSSRLSAPLNVPESIQKSVGTNCRRFTLNADALRRGGVGRQQGHDQSAGAWHVRTPGAICLLLLNRPSKVAACCLSACPQCSNAVQQLATAGLLA